MQIRPRPLALSLATLVLASGVLAGDPGMPSPTPPPPAQPGGPNAGLDALAYTVELSADRFCPGGRTSADAGRDGSSQTLGITVRARSAVGWRVTVAAGGGALRMYDVSRPNVELGLVGFHFEGTFGARRNRVVANANLRPPNNPGRYRVELRTGTSLKALAEFTVGYSPDSCPQPTRRRRRRGHHPQAASEAPPPGFPASQVPGAEDPNWDDLHGPGDRWPGSYGPDHARGEDERVPETPQKIFQ